MTSFNEDKIFKNIQDVDVQILLDIIGKKSKKAKIWTKELRLLDPKDYLPDLIMELDFENLILEFQSTPVGEDFSKRALTYLAMVNRYKNNDKKVNLAVLSTAEESKTVEYEVGDSVFRYNIISLKDFDAEEIINNVESKIKTGLKIDKTDLILYALIPIIVKEDIENYIIRVTHNLIKVDNIRDSIINLAYGIEWLVADKFIKDEETRNLLCDLLGGRMSLIDEYGDRRAKQERKKTLKEVIVSMLEYGDSFQDISLRTKKSVEEIKNILNDNTI